MTVMLELAPEVELLAKARAEAKGISLEDYLPSLVAEAIQQEDWKDVGVTQLESKSARASDRFPI